MKKIISLLLVILMLCSMLFAVSCSDTSDDGDETSSSELPSQSAQKLVEDSIEKIDNLDSYRAILTQNITVTMQGFTMQTPVTVDIMVEGLSSGNLKIYTYQTVEMMGESTTLEMYIADGFAYANSDGEKGKIDLSQFGTQAESIMYNKTIDQLLQVLPEDVMKDVAIKTNDDNEKYVEVDFDPTKFLQLYQESVSDLSTELGVSIDDIQISDSKVKIVLTKTGYIKEYILTYKMAISVMGQAANADVNLKIEFIEPGKAVTVTPMDDYLEYPSAS